MDKTNSDILNGYWGLIKTLNTGWKLDLIERLTQSVRKNLLKSSNSMKLSFGAWESKSTAEEIITELRNSRTTNREIESL